MRTSLRIGAAAVAATVATAGAIAPATAAESQGPKNRTGSHSPMYLLNKCFLRIYHVPGLGGTDVSKTKNSCPPGADLVRKQSK